MKQLNFAEEHRYPDDDEGIPIRVKLSYAGQSLEVTAKKLIPARQSVFSATTPANGSAFRLNKASRNGSAG